MKKDSNYFDLIDPVGIVSASSIVHPECSVVGISHHVGVGLIPLTIYIYIYIYIVISFDMVSYLCFLICYCCC